MSYNLDYIQELGIGLEDATQTDAETNNTTNESEEDLSLDSEEPTPTDGDSKDNIDEDTEPKIDEGMQKQIDMLEKRIKDKDDYINTLREQSKGKEAEADTEVGDTTEDFWDDPEAKFKQLQDTMRLQQLQIQETVYANTVDDYWKTVNPEALQEAVATDPEFGKEFNGSSEPYKTAYEYLNKKATQKKTDADSLKESIRQELIKEMGLEKKSPKKEVIPNMNNLGGSSGSKSEVPDDGFSAVFGQ